MNFSRVSRLSAFIGCACRPAARTTTRISSARRSSRRPTATCRRRTRWSASLARSRQPRRSKRDIPQLAIVGSGYSYLQEWLPHVAQHSVRQGLADVIGVGRLRPQLSGAAGRRDRRAAAEDELLAARSATARRRPQRARFGVLPARSVLRRSTRRRSSSKRSRKPWRCRRPRRRSGAEHESLASRCVPPGPAKRNRCTTVASTSR